MTKFQDGTIHTSHVKGYQIHAIGKAIRPLFADPVTKLLLRSEEDPGAGKGSGTNR